MSFGDWSKVFELKPRYLLAIWLFGALLLLSPLYISERFGFASIVTNYRGWIGLFSLAFFTLWVVQIVSQYQEKRTRRRNEEKEEAKKKNEEIRAQERQSETRAEILKAIDTLSKKELFLLLYALDKNQQTVFATVVNRFARALCAKGLLRPAPAGDTLKFPYTIPNFVWNHLKDHESSLFEVLPEFDEWKAIYEGSYDLLRKSMFGDL